MPTEKKNQTIEKLRERAGASRNLFFTDMRGLTVSDMRTLRQSLRKEAATYAVVKNTLFRIAVGEEKAGLFREVLEGPTGVAFAGDDPVGVAKALSQFAADSKKLQIKAAYVDGKVFAPAEVAALAKIPRRPELIAKLLGGLKSPLYRLAHAVGGNRHRLVHVLHAVHAKKASST